MRPGNQIMYDTDNQIDIRENGLVITIWHGSKIENVVKQGSENSATIIHETIKKLKGRKQWTASKF